MSGRPARRARIEAARVAAPPEGAVPVTLVLHPTPEHLHGCTRGQKRWWVRSPDGDYLPIETGPMLWAHLGPHTVGPVWLVPGDTYVAGCGRCTRVDVRIDESAEVVEVVPDLTQRAPVAEVRAGVAVAWTDPRVALVSLVRALPDAQVEAARVALGALLVEVGSAPF